MVSTRAGSLPGAAPRSDASSASRPTRRSPGSSATSRTGRGSISWSRRSHARAGVAPREGGPLAVVVAGETGLLVAPRDADALADALATLLADPARRVAMGHAGRSRVDAVFDIRHHVAAMEALFEDVLAQ